MQRVLCLRLPNWSRQRLRRNRPAPEQQQSSPPASPPDPWQDVAALKKLARWCRRYSPVVGLEDAQLPESLLLDITGCAHLFGGEESLAALVVRDVARLKLRAYAAIADTIGAAWAAAFCASLKPDRSSVVIPSGQQGVALEKLPVQALRISPAIIDTLRELDLRTIGQLQQLPRETLPSRFSAELLRRLDQALGRVQELIVPVRADEPVEARWGCEEPIGNALAIEAVLRRLLCRVIHGVRARGEGILRLEISLACAEQQPVQISIRCIQPTLRRKHLLDLIRLQLERLCVVDDNAGRHAPPLSQVGATGSSSARVFERRATLALADQQPVAPPNMRTSTVNDVGCHAHAFSRGHASKTCPPKRGGHGTHHSQPLGRGVVDFLVRVAATAALSESQPNLFGDPDRREGRRELDVLLNRLSNRLGRSAVIQPELCPDHQPERAVEFRPIIGEKKTKPRDVEVFSPRARPLRVLPRPVPVAVTSLVPDGPPICLRWRNADHRIVHSDGPERIETGWWRQAPVRRDYYRIDTDSGGRYWLFRTMDDGRWFLHGDF